MPGDGIGPEITDEAVNVLKAVVADSDLKLSFTDGLIGGAAYDAKGEPFPETTRQQAAEADAVLLGAVGSPQYDSLERPLRPERGLLAIRKTMGLFANLRPAMLYSALADASSLKPQVVSGLDILIVRELTGGVYFGQPRGIRELDGQREGFNTMHYNEAEIERIGRVAFEAAQKRNKRLCSVDKANVLETSELWREVMNRLSTEYPDVELSHMYVDNAAMQLVRLPKQFDVMVTENLFGDILSDQASMLTGSIGMLPSASLNETGQGLYEPSHGSAPDIAGKGVANPMATILSAAMMLRYSFGRSDLAAQIETACVAVLDQGLRTPDIMQEGMTQVSTSDMGQAVVGALSV
ncbi:3-isopropylmalate dehydrogenase [Guyparkeria sp.]|uniref:3-isopropylmalate dehydrogenase n=1 Tax=Guyparkeria sp. TaxID=2035736 RepID=UPI003970C029